MYKCYSITSGVKFKNNQDANFILICNKYFIIERKKENEKTKSKVKTITQEQQYQKSSMFGQTSFYAKSFLLVNKENYMNSIIVPIYHVKHSMGWFVYTDCVYGLFKLSFVFIVDTKTSKARTISILLFLQKKMYMNHTVFHQVVYQVFFVNCSSTDRQQLCSSKNIMIICPKKNIS